MSYIGQRPDSFGYTSTSYDHFSGNNSQTVYTLSRSVTANGDIFVTVANVPQDPGVAYFVTNLNTLTFTSPPPSGTNNIVVVYRGMVQSGIAPAANTVTAQQIAANTIQAYHLSNSLLNPVTNIFTGNGSTVNFTLSQSAVSSNACFVTVNGITQAFPSNYSVNGTTLTFTSAPSVGAVIRCVQNSIVGTSIVPIDGSVTNSKLASNLTLTGNTITGNLVVNGTLSANVANNSIVGNITSSQLANNLTLTGNTIHTGFVSAVNGLYSTNNFTGTYTNGIVVDYVNGNGRISVGPSNGITFYNGGVANTALITINQYGNLLLSTNTASGNPLIVNGSTRSMLQGNRTNLAFQIDNTNGPPSWAQPNLIGHYWTGSQDATSIRAIASGIANTGSYDIFSDGSHRWYTSASSGSTGSTSPSSMMVDTYGNFIIGTISNPSSFKFITYLGHDGNAANIAANTGSLIYQEYTGTSYLWNQNTNLLFGTSTNNNLSFGTNNTVRAYFNGAGNFYFNGTLYDNTNTSYYLKPSATTNLNALNVGGYPVNSWEKTTYSVSGYTYDVTNGVRYFWTKIATLGGEGSIVFEISTKTDVNYMPYVMGIGVACTFNGSGIHAKLDVLTSYDVTVYIAVDNSNNVWLYSSAVWDSYVNWRIKDVSGTCTIYTSSFVQQYTVSGAVSISPGYQVNGSQGSISSATPGISSSNYFGAVQTAGNMYCGGALSKSSGSFRIDHPLPQLQETHELVHSFIEGPQADLIYRGKVDLVKGSATINMDEVSGMTEGTFVILCRDIQCFTTNESDWTPVKGTISDNILTIQSQDPESNSSISWLVIGERQDKHMYNTDWTDVNGKVIVEPIKPEDPMILEQKIPYDKF